MKGREKSDGRIVPQARRKSGPTASKMRGGKATTASEQMSQLQLFFETADSPKGDVAEAAKDRSLTATSAVPKSKCTKRKMASAMTMEEIASHGNLREAFRKVEANKGAPGPDGRSINEVREQLDELLPRLQRELLDGSYCPGLIRRVWIPKPGGGQRGLGIPDVIDRLVQQAVYQVLSPYYETGFHSSSHGFRPGRSCHTAIREAKRHMEEGYEWVVDIDLAKFFDRVHHDRLLSKLELRVHDRRLIQLIRRMLKAKVVMPDGVVMSTEEGTPQGGPLSPLLSNIVLDELDWELDRRGHRFVRYADDCNIYVRSERAGYRVMQSIRRFIERRLRLAINVDKSAVAQPDSRHFVGFRLCSKSIPGSAEVLLSERSFEQLKRKIVELTPRNWGQSLEDCIQRLNSYLRGWFGFFQICTGHKSFRLFGNADAHIRRRLRALVLRHWKRRRTMARRLIQLGVSPKTAWRTIYKGAPSIWALSQTAAVHRGLRNSYFDERNLYSLKEAWLKVHSQPYVDASGQRSLRLWI